MFITKEKIDELIKDIKKDTRRTKMFDLGELALDVSYAIGDSKGKLVEIKFDMREMEKALKKKFRGEGVKYTIDEIKTKIDDDFNYRDKVQARKFEEKVIEERIDLLKTIGDFINLVKFLDRSTIAEEKFINNNI